jgi:hypothetical protein
MTHEDLANNLWVNPTENQDGYTGDLHGINVIANSGDPTDDLGHGTHVAGIIAAQGNNGKGIAGVAWQSQLMLLKMIGKDANGNVISSIGGAITALEFARTHGASIINASWGNYSYSQLLYNELLSLRNAGIIFVAAADNSGVDNDVNLTYPSCYQLDNVVSVAASTESNTLAYFSCYGYQNVSLAAPGADILSTYYLSDVYYTNLSGTSMAAPHVTGALALLKAASPSDSYHTTIWRLLAGVTRLGAFEGKVASGGVLNLYQSLQSVSESSPPNDNFVNSQQLSGRSTTVYGLTIGATKEPGEPNHAGNPGGSSVWYSWTAPSAGRVEITTAKSITTAGSTLNTLLGVYTGSSVTALTTIASNDDSGITGDGTTTSRVTFNAVPGTTYRVAVDGYNGAQGLIRLSINYAPKNDDLVSAEHLNGPQIAVQGTTLGAGKESGEPNHAGNQGGRSVWWSWVAPENGTVTLTTEGSTFDTLLAVYTGSVYPLTAIASNDNDSSSHGDDYGQLTSTVTFPANAGNVYKIAIDGVGGAGGHFVLAGGYQYVINTPSLVGSYPATAAHLNRLGHYTGQTSDGNVYVMTTSLVTFNPLGYGGVGVGINDSDQIVGQAADVFHDNYAITWDAVHGVSRLDSNSGSSDGKAVNNFGLTAGLEYLDACSPGPLPNYYASPVYWQNNSMIVLPDLGGGQGWANDVNDLDEIVGISFSSRSGCTFYGPQGIYWGQLAANGAGTISLGTLGGGSEAMGLGSGGDILGHSSVPGGRLFGALFRDGKVINLGTLGDGQTFGYGHINDHRQAAVQWGGMTFLNQVNDFGFRAGLWQNNVLIDLNKLIPAQSTPGWESVGASVDPISTFYHDINQHGTIVGTGIYKPTVAAGSEVIAAFVLTPANYLQIQSPSFSPNHIFSFTVEGASGTTCGVQASPDCVSWTQIGSVTLQNGKGTFTDNNAPQYSSRFYRVNNGSETCGDVVGFLSRQIPAGQSMVANPFEGADNRIPALLSAAADGTTVYKWDEVNQGWLICTKFGGVWTPYPLMSLYPGEGMIISSASSFTASFAGRIRQNCLEKIVNPKFAIHSSLAPLAGSVDATLGFPISNGDSIEIMVDTAGNYTTYTYNNGAWSPNIPSITLGTSFWSSKTAGAKWRQNFSVW